MGRLGRRSHGSTEIDEAETLEPTEWAWLEQGVWQISVFRLFLKPELPGPDPDRAPKAQRTTVPLQL